MTADATARTAAEDRQHDDAGTDRRHTNVVVAMKPGVLRDAVVELVGSAVGLWTVGVVDDGPAALRCVIDTRADTVLVCPSLVVDPERLINAVAALSWSPDVVAYSIDPLEEAACAAVGAVVLSAGTPESLIADTLISLGRARRSG